MNVENKNKNLDQSTRNDIPWLQPGYKDDSLERLLRKPKPLSDVFYGECGECGKEVKANYVLGNYYCECECGNLVCFDGCNDDVRVVVCSECGYESENTNQDTCPDCYGELCEQRE